MPKIIEDIVIRNQDENSNPPSKTGRSFLETTYHSKENKIEETNYVREKEERDRNQLNEPLYKTVRPKYRPLREETKNRRSGVWIFAVIAVVALFIGLGTLLSEAKVVVYPKQELVSLNGDEFGATLNQETQTSASYQFISVSDSISEDVEFTESEEREVKASGKIVIYNEFSSAPQKLIATTRFESPSGLIYMMDEAVTVPGTTTKNGVVTPGSVEATVTAEKTGTNYNTDPTDFTIPGFKGTSKYSKFYARSEGPIDGGATGIVYFLSQEKDTELQTKLREDLHQRLKERLSSETPENFVIFENSFVFESKSNTGSSVESTTQSGVFELTGTLGAYAIDKDELAKQISIKKGILGESLNGDGVTLLDSDSLTLTSNQVLTLEPPASWTFKLSGETSVGALINQNALAGSLAGRTRKEAKLKLSEFIAIEKADVILSPFWRKTLPEDPESIVVETRLDQ